jgi:hypothetical protein
MGSRNFVTLGYQAYFYWKEGQASPLPHLMVVPNDISHQNFSKLETCVDQLASRMFMRWDV